MKFRQVQLAPIIDIRQVPASTHHDPQPRQLSVYHETGLRARYFRRGRTKSSSNPPFPTHSARKPLRPCSPLYTHPLAARPRAEDLIIVLLLLSGQGPGDFGRGHGRVGQERLECLRKRLGEGGSEGGETGTVEWLWVGRRKTGELHGTIRVPEGETYRTHVTRHETSRHHL